MAKKKNASSGAGCALVMVFLVIGLIYSGISSCVGNAAGTQPSDDGDYSTVVPDYTEPSLPDYDDPSFDGSIAPSAPDGGLDDGTDDGTDVGGGDSTDGGGGDLNLPGNGYVTGPGVNCGLSGCGVDVVPHFGWHF